MSNIQQVYQTIQPLPALPDNDSELSKVTSNGARRHGSLADQQASYGTKNQKALVVDALMGTNRIWGRVTASQIAVASGASSSFVLEN
ncbi:hypothetical protein [Bradyrhizobium sp. USDA 4529]